MGHFHQRWLQNLGSGLHLGLDQIYSWGLNILAQAPSQKLKKKMPYSGILLGNTERDQFKRKQKSTHTMRYAENRRYNVL